MKQYLLIIPALLGSLCPWAQVQYFPPGALDGDPPNVAAVVVEAYSRNLSNLKEPSLWSPRRQLHVTSYRFLWLRSFDNPVSVRFEIDDDGTARLIAKIFDRSAERIMLDKNKTLSRDEVRELMGHLEDMKFWDAPTSDRGRIGTDGAEWVIEGVSNGKYHLLHRWSPRTGAIRNFGECAIRIAGIPVAPGKLY
jgi:hypothetical protein